MKKILRLLIISSLYLVSQEDTNEDIEEIVAVGTKASLKSALDKQKDSNQVVSIVDSDAIGEFPDETAAEAVRRLSGVSVENDQGEGRYITLRGMSGDLNGVTLNGATVPAPEGGRKVLLDGLPTELLDSIEVYKTLIPSQDLEGIGGRIEFKTKKATELDKRLVKIKYDQSYNDFSGEADSPKYSLTYGEKLSDAFGAILGYTYQSKHIISNNNETGYEPWGIADNGNKYLARDWEMRFYDLTRERQGFTADFDLALNDDTSLFYNFLFNKYEDDEIRFKDEYRARNLVESSVTPTSASYQRITADKETRKRIEVRTIETKIFGGESRLGMYNTKFQFSESFAEEDDTNNVDAKFRAQCRIRSGDDICGTYSWANPKFISLSLAPRGQMLTDPSEYDWDELEIDYGLIQDREDAFKIDFESDPFDFNGNVMSIEFGAKSSERIKSNKEGNLDGSGDVAQGMLTYSPSAPNNLWYFPEALSFFADPSLVFPLQNQFRPLDLDLADFWSTKEEIFALYFMATIETDNAVVVVGFRNEDTSFETYGFNDGDQQDRLEFENDYSFLAPSINVKYFLNDKVQLRAAAYRSLSRPGFEQTAPVPDIGDGNGDGEWSGSMGNPDLKPYEANNYDLGFEYYGDESFFSAGLYYKDISNTIYPRVLGNQIVGGIFFSDLETFANAGDSSILGYELNYFTELDAYLPLEGFFVSANVTYNDGESDFAPGGDNTETFTIPFRKLSEEAANFSLGYDKGKFDIRFSVNYRSSYLDYLGDEGEELFNDDFGYGYMRFTDDYYSYDLVAKYKYTENLSLRFEGKNLDNRPEFYYWNSPDRLSQYDEYGYWMSFGFRYNF